MKNILYGLVALFLVFVISSCGENGSTATSRTPTVTTVTQPEGKASVTLEVDKTQVIANGTDGITLTVTVKDTTGSPLAQQEVTFNVPLSLALSYPPPTPLTTDDNGQVILILRPLGPDTISPFNQYPTDIKQGVISATCLGVTSIPIAITVNPRPPVIISSVILVANKTQAIANGSDTIAITATVYDGNGYPIPYQAISFNVSPGANRFMSPVSTDINGKAVIQLSVSPTPALITDKVITVSAASGGITSPTINLTYTPPPQVTPALVTLTSDKTVMLADGTDRITFTIFAYDSNGVGIAGQFYRLYPPPGPFSTATNIVTNALGQGLSSLMYNIYEFPRLAVSTTRIPMTAMVNGTISNTIFITMNPL